MLNPINMTRLADLLRQGSILKRPFQPYESHLQYLLQWMCDFNLNGCDYINCSKVRFRGPVPEYENTDDSANRWNSNSIPKEIVSDEDEFPKQSHCSLEVDVCVEDIINRREIKARHLHHNFIESLDPSPHDEKLVHSMAGLWRDETIRRRNLMPSVSTDRSPFPPEVLISVSAELKSSQRCGWVHEAEYLDKVRQIIIEESMRSESSQVNLESFIETRPFENKVNTALESVQDLFSANLRSSYLLARHDRTASNVVDVEVEVDESRILDIGKDEYALDSEESQASELEMQQQRSDLSHPHDARPRDIEIKNDTNVELEQIKLPEDSNSSSDMRGKPISSGDLEKLGIHNLTFMSHEGEDKFEIPLEYTSEISKNRKSSHGAEGDTAQDTGNMKRRKLRHDGPMSSAESGMLSSAKTTQANKSSRKLKLAEFHLTKDYQPFSNTTLRGCSKAIPTPLKSSPKSSQESLKSNSTTGNKTLSFPIVKDPHGSEASSRASRQSSSWKTEIQHQSKLAPFEGSLHQRKGCRSVDDRLNGLESEERLNSTQVIALATEFGASPFYLCSQSAFLISEPPPSTAIVSSSMTESDLMPVIHRDAYYSDEKDVPERARDYAGREFLLKSDTTPFLPAFDPKGNSAATKGIQSSTTYDKSKAEMDFIFRRNSCGLRNWEISTTPPLRREVERWYVEKAQLANSNDWKDGVANEHKLLQVEGPTQKDRHGFKYTQKQKETSVRHGTQYMSTMSLEVHVNTEGNMLPNPEKDEIACIFWCLKSDDDEICEGFRVGVLVLSEAEGLANKISRHLHVEVEEESSELNLLNKMVDLVRFYDPDILTGYEVHNGSWGYLIERARFMCDFNLCNEFSRMKTHSHGRFGKENDRWGFDHTSTIRVTGRHMINIWRAMRSELNLLQYTLENVTFHVLHRRVPHYSWSDLTAWYKSNRPHDLAKVLDYYISRCQIDLEILEQNELIPRTSEQARLLGVDFFSVFSRGSQFKVESLMFRIAKPENFLLVSPSRKQVGQQNALECLPLVMEPQSDFYSSPVLVLDFQSLYPSVMIAYNYCYSTFLGRVIDWRGHNKMGFTEYKRKERLLELLEGHINIAPNGIMYAAPNIRKSLLAKMLGEILETRVMVKSGMNVDKDDKTLQRLLNNRQLALKLIANVTYGYTSASFSGRMPCSEIADSIVQTGRETLERAIALIHSVERWGAEVVYGDTDSLFVHLKGRSKDEAFDIGNDIAQTITKSNPRPVKLKFEKVYFPCVLLAKKRYVGYKYETKDQKEPEFDAKGIETVRRDGTPVEQKVEERALKILFRTADLSQVKSYFQDQCTKIMKGQVSIQDFCFAKEVRLGSYSDKGPPPPGALVSTRRMLKDPRAEPQYGERVPYVVITGAPGARLIDRCVAPEVLIHDE